MKIGVLGGGQLGWMLGHAADRLGHECVFLDPNAECPAARIGELIVADFTDEEALATLAGKVDVVTCEFENVPAESLRIIGEQTPIHPSPRSFEVAQDRLEEKRFIDRLGIPVPAFTQVDSAEDLPAAIGRIGLPAVLKSRSGGYDGKSQLVIREEMDPEEAFQQIGGRPAILETMVSFQFEASVLVVRSRDGDVSAWDPILNEHRGGILHRSVCPCPNLPHPARLKMQAHAADIVRELEHVGVLAVEFFVIGEKVWVNEFAPRVHNSGHLTIEYSATSQFENHIRAVAGLELGMTDPFYRGASALMMNVVGNWPSREDLLHIEMLRIHDYGKSPRPGRKLGHVTGIYGDLEWFNDVSNRLEGLLGRD
ncbi:MAG: 5-(carboxyamino)imidazole ribonucleotide synthase [Phycisphaerales bacterium]|nr:5-(carboxyamino)imidazole ribonucleotide synthase [Phycisphaerales bacterium]